MGQKMKTFLTLLIIKPLCKINRKDKDLINIAKNSKVYSMQNFHSANKKYSCIYRNLKIAIPEQLVKKVVE